jgi:hypothetical protein
MLMLAPPHLGCATDRRGQRMSTTIERKQDDAWIIRVTRAHGAASAKGVVAIRQATEPAAATAPHLALAGARAWLALGNQALAGKRDDEAIACARAGLNELGHDYAPPTVEDDTELKVLAADDLIKDGKRSAGAAMLLRMLEERMQLYVRRNAATLAE